MLFQPALVPFRVIALATAAILLPVSEANAFRIIHVQDAAATVKSSTVRFIYPKNFQRSAPVNSTVARKTRTVIVNNVATSYSLRINVNVNVYRRPAWYWNRNGGIRLRGIRLPTSCRGVSSFRPQAASSGNLRVLICSPDAALPAIKPYSAA